MMTYPHTLHPSNHYPTTIPQPNGENNRQIDYIIFTHQIETNLDPLLKQEKTLEKNLQQLDQELKLGLELELGQELGQGK